MFLRKIIKQSLSTILLIWILFSTNSVLALSEQEVFEIPWTYGGESKDSHIKNYTSLINNGVINRVWDNIYGWDWKLKIIIEKETFESVSGWASSMSSSKWNDTWKMRFNQMFSQLEKTDGGTERFNEIKSFYQQNEPFLLSITDAIITNEHSGDWTSSPRNWNKGAKYTTQWPFQLYRLGMWDWLYYSTRWEADNCYHFWKIKEWCHTYMLADYTKFMIGKKPSFDSRFYCNVWNVNTCSDLKQVLASVGANTNWDEIKNLVKSFNTKTSLIDSSNRRSLGYIQTIIWNTSSLWLETKQDFENLLRSMYYWYAHTLYNWTWNIWMSNFDNWYSYNNPDIWICIKQATVDGWSAKTWSPRFWEGSVIWQLKMENNKRWIQIVNNIHKMFSDNGLLSLKAQCRK